MATRGFGSDNHASVHPRVFQALQEANQGHAPSYGTDIWTEKANALFRQHFGENAKAFFVFNGTAANVLSLACLLRPGEAVLCSDVAHLHVDEAAAPEFFTGAKVFPVPSTQGKLRVEDLEAQWIRRGDVHFAQSRVLSLTQPTELGTLYSLAELKELIAWAKQKQLFVHMDGARLGVAATALGVGFKELTTDLGVDLLSFGGTKNGLLGGEAVLVLNPALGSHIAVLRKMSGQLPSKSRFLAAQFIAYLENNLWREIAESSIRQARRLREGLAGVTGIEITQPTQANAVFARIPKGWLKPLREKYFFYVWDEKTWECRWMTSWDLQDADTDGFLSAIKECAR